MLTYKDVRKTSVQWMGKVLDVRSPELFVQITVGNDRNKIEVSCVETTYVSLLAGKYDAGRRDTCQYQLMRQTGTCVSFCACLVFYMVRS